MVFLSESELGLGERLVGGISGFVDVEVVVVARKNVLLVLDADILAFLAGH